MNQRKQFLSVRLNLRERAQLAALCKSSGLTPSTAVRKLIAGTKISANHAKDMKPLYAEINKIGSNINQIAKSVNMGMASQEDVRQSLLLLQKVYDILERWEER